MPYLTGKNDAKPHEALFWRFGKQWAIRKGEWKLVVSRVDGVDKPAALFNLKDDLGEATNLAEKESAKVTELKADWDKWNAEQKPPLWIPRAMQEQPKKPSSSD